MNAQSWLKTQAKWFARLKREPVQAWLLCLPALALFGVFYLGPTLVGLAISVTDWDGVKPAPRFVGLTNYIALVKGDTFWKVLLTNMLMATALVCLQLPFALFLALGLRRRTRLNTFFRMAFFLPQALSVTVAALVWRFMFTPSAGLFNRVLMTVGLGGLQRAWLGETQTALMAVTASFMWWTFGFFTILFIAGLSAIPDMYFDAFLIESDRWYLRLRYVTLPMLRETLLIAFAMTISNAFGFALGYVDLMTHGGPASSTELLGLYATRAALLGRRFGYSSAITLAMLAIVLGLVIGPLLYVGRERLEYTE